MSPKMQEATLESPAEMRLDYQKEVIQMWLASRYSDLPLIDLGRCGNNPRPGFLTDCVADLVKHFSLRPTEQVLESGQVTDVFEAILHGGSMTPHVHLDGKIYVLTAKQWEYYSDAVRKVMLNKLQTAGKVSFAKLNAAAKAVEAL